MTHEDEIMMMERTRTHSTGLTNHTAVQVHSPLCVPEGYLEKFAFIADKVPARNTRLQTLQQLLLLYQRIQLSRGPALAMSHATRIGARRAARFVRAVFLPYLSAPQGSNLLPTPPHPAGPRRHHCQRSLTVSAPPVVCPGPACRTITSTTTGSMWQRW